LVEDSIAVELNKLGFFDNENCMMCNRDTMVDKIKWICDENNRVAVDVIRQKGMDLVRNNHTTLHRSMEFHDMLKSLQAKPYKNKAIFEKIYENQVWNDGHAHIPLSGPGSSLENTRDFAALLDRFVYEKQCRSVLDVGCGDLTWMPKTRLFKDDQIQYTGVDIVESLVQQHAMQYPSKRFYCTDVTVDELPESASIIVIRDVLFHLKNEEILSIFKHIKHKFDYIAITSCKNSVNHDNFDVWRFAEKNILIEPFCRPTACEAVLHEDRFNRCVYIYNHAQFYQGNQSPNYDAPAKTTLT